VPQEGVHHEEAESSHATEFLGAGRAPLCPYNSLLAKDTYCHGSWMDYSGGWTPGMAPHIIDLPVWALDIKYPTEVSSAGGRFIVKDDGDVYGHVLWVAADQVTGVDSELIPTGAFSEVKGTPLDFTSPTARGARIDQLTPPFAG